MNRRKFVKRFGGLAAGIPILGAFFQAERINTSLPPEYVENLKKYEEGLQESISNSFSVWDLSAAPCIGEEWQIVATEIENYNAVFFKDPQGSPIKDIYRHKKTGEKLIRRWQFHGNSNTGKVWLGDTRELVT